MVLGTNGYDDQIVFLIYVSLHKVNLAYAFKLLLKHINVSIEAVVSQQRDKVNDLFDVLFTVCLVCNKHLPLLQ